MGTSDFSTRNRNFGVPLYAVTLFRLERRPHGVIAPSFHTYPVPSHFRPLLPVWLLRGNRYWLPVNYAQSPTCPAVLYFTRVRVCMSALRLLRTAPHETALDWASRVTPALPGKDLHLRDSTDFPDSRPVVTYGNLTAVVHNQLAVVCLQRRDCPSHTDKPQDEPVVYL